jgi:hypothetical protein
MTEGSKKRWRLAIFAVAFVIRIAAIGFHGPEDVAFGDARDYLATASHLCREREYPDHGNLPFFRAPALPFFIAATTLCHPERVVVVKLALAAVDSGTALIIGEIAWLLFESSGAAAIAALLAALYPFFIFLAVWHSRSLRSRDPPDSRQLRLPALRSCLPEELEDHGGRRRARSRRG